MLVVCLYCFFFVIYILYYVFFILEKNVIEEFNYLYSYYVFLIIIYH